jgi:hypothetical protein
MARVWIMWCAVIVWCGTAGAQELTFVRKEPPVGTVTGVVFDSLVSKQVLAGAQLWLEGTELTATSDATGRYRFDKVPVGSYTLTVLHPLLDSLGVPAPSRELTVIDKKEAVVPMGTPSEATVLGVLCAAQRVDSASGVLVGSVSERGTGVALEGASVMASWSLYTIGKAVGGLRQEVRTATSTTDASGTFRLCGVPVDVPVQLRTVALNGSTSVMETTLDGQYVGLRALRVEPARADEADATPAPLHGAPTAGASNAPLKASLTATVRTPGGRPISGVQTSVIGVRAGAISNDSGVVTLADVPTGTQVVEFRAIGYRPLRTRVSLRGRGVNRLDVTMDDRLLQLAPINVVSTLQRERFISEFDLRRKGGGGVYFDQEWIRQRKALAVNDMLAGVPGVKVVQYGYSSVVTFQRSMGVTSPGIDGCRPTYFVDGIRVGTDDAAFTIDHFVRPEEMYGMEVYKNVANAPAQYQSTTTSCGLILVWTKRKR